MRPTWRVPAYAMTITAIALFMLFSPSPVALAGSPITFNAMPQVDRSAGSSVRLTWRTGDELQTAGYNLYRSDQKDGVYEKINAHLIPASTDVFAGGEYTFEDAGVQPGQTFYYRLEVIDLNGQSKRLEAHFANLPSLPTYTKSTSPFALEGGMLAALVTGAIAGLWRLGHG